MFRDGSLRHGHPASQRHPGRTRAAFQDPLPATRGDTPSYVCGRGRPFCTGGACTSSPGRHAADAMRCVSQRGSARSLSRAVCSPSFLTVRDGAGGNAPVPVADPEGGRVALFMVQPETLWPHDRAGLSASAATLERDSRTVKQVTFPVHGVSQNGAPRRPCLHRVPRRTATGVQPVLGLGALRAATRAVQRSRPGAAHGPTYAAKPHRGTGCVTPLLWGVTQPAAPATTRNFTAIRR